LVNYYIAGGVCAYYCGVKEMIDYIMYGLLGAVTYTLIRWGFWREKGYDYLARHFVWGAIAGVLVAAFGLPNQLTAFGLGYAGIDAAEGLVERMASRKSKT
jgi:hypothetical protein